VLTYTTAAPAEDAEVLGDVEAEVWFRSSLPFADVFVRLCDVDPQGRSMNVCDGLTSLTGADELTCAAVRLWPTAHRFRRGHCISTALGSGIQRGVPALCAKPRYRRVARHGHRTPGGRPGGAPRSGPSVRDHSAGATSSMI
jgi:predicted acyl esterase